MLWIFIGIAVVLIVVGFFTLGSDDGATLGVGCIVFFVLGIVLCIALQCRHSTIHNSTAQIAVLEENNTELLAEIQPVIEKYLNYEQGTLASMKPEASTLIAYAVYPELKGNEFVARQLDIIEKNNKEIKERKLALASLESYRIWLFMGEPKK